MSRRVCMFDWNDNCGRLGSNHVCGEAHGHSGDHKCAGCDAVYSLPLVQAITAAVDVKQLAPALLDAIEALFDIPANPKPGDVADRVARFLDLVGTAPAKALADKLREARNDGDRLMSLLPELEGLDIDGVAVTS